MPLLGLAELRNKLFLIDETIQLQKNDLKILEKINNLFSLLPDENDPLQLIDLANLLKDLNPRVGFVRNDYQQVIPWKHMIYMQKIALILYNNNKELLVRFYVDFLQNDFNELKIIFFQMRNQAFLKVNASISTREKLENKIKNYKSSAKELAQLNEGKKALEDISKKIPQLVAFLKAGMKSKNRENIDLIIDALIKMLKNESDYELKLLLQNIKNGEQPDSIQVAIEKLNLLKNKIDENVDDLSNEINSFEEIEKIKTDIHVLKKDTENKIILCFLEVYKLLEIYSDIISHLPSEKSTTLMKKSANITGSLKEILNNLKLLYIKYHTIVHRLFSDKLETLDKSLLDGLENFIKNNGEDNNSPSALAKKFLDLAFKLNNGFDIKEKDRNNIEHLEYILRAVIDVKDKKSCFGTPHTDALKGEIEKIKNRLPLVNKTPALNDCAKESIELIGLFIESAEKEIFSIKKLEKLEKRISGAIKQYENNINPREELPFVKAIAIKKLGFYFFDQENLRKISAILIDFFKNSNPNNELFRYVFLQVLFEIGECCHDISLYTQNLEKSISWALIIALRNSITHEAMDKLNAQIKLDNFLIFNPEQPESIYLSRLLISCTMDLENFLTKINHLSLSNDIRNIQWDKIPSIEQYESAQPQQAVNIVENEGSNSLIVLHNYLKNLDARIEFENNLPICIVEKKQEGHKLEANNVLVIEGMLKKLSKIIAQVEFIYVHISNDINDHNLLYLASKFIYLYFGEIIRTLKTSPYREEFQRCASKALINEIDRIIRVRGDIAHNLLIDESSYFGLKSLINELAEKIIPEIKVTIYHTQISKTRISLGDFIKAKTSKEFLKQLLGNFNSQIKSQIDSHFNAIIEIAKLDNPARLNYVIAETFTLDIFYKLLAAIYYYDQYGMTVYTQKKQELYDLLFMPLKLMKNINKDVGSISTAFKNENREKLDKKSIREIDKKLKALKSEIENYSSTIELLNYLISHIKLKDELENLAIDVINIESSNFGQYKQGFLNLLDSHKLLLSSNENECIKLVELIDSLKNEITQEGLSDHNSMIRTIRTNLDNFIKKLSSDYFNSTYSLMRKMKIDGQHILFKQINDLLLKTSYATHLEIYPKIQLQTQGYNLSERYNQIKLDILDLNKKMSSFMEAELVKMWNPAEEQKYLQSLVNYIFKNGFQKDENGKFKKKHNFLNCK